MDRQAEALNSLLARITSKEAEPEEAEGGFAGEFSMLKTLSTKYRTEKIFSMKVAEKRENVKKNRYKDIMPFDHTRVKLSFITSDTDTDYINASFIKGALQQRAYIATQGPLPHTVQDFWRMIWEYNVKIIVMACREFEMGRKKCERYWPEKGEEPFVCDPFTIHYESMESKGDYLTRVLKVTYRNTSRMLWQLHYVNWPDHGVPASIPPILELLQEMRSYQEHDDVPICIHCSAGCGRTGVLCVIDYTWKLLRNQLITEDFCIFKLVQEMRTQRPSIVQTKEQYELVYRTIKILFENYLQMMVSHSSAVEVPASPTPSPVSSESDLTAPCEVLNLDQEEEVHLVPWPRHMKREEPKELTNWETAGGLSLVLPRLPAEEDGCNGLVSQSSKCSPEDTLSSLIESSRQRAQEEWDFQSERHISQHAKMAGVAELIPKSWTMALPTQEDATTQSPSRGSWNAPQEEEVALLELEANPNSPGYWEFSCFSVEDPYFSPSSPQDSQATLDPEELPPFDSRTSNLCLTTPALTLNDHPLVLPQFETLATVVTPVSDEDIPPTPPERTPESFILADSPVSPATPVSDEDNPPSLPERTPESYILAYSPDSPERPPSSDSERLLTVLPLNTTETLCGNGSPPSPVPPLPERTPESFILATDDDLLQGVAQHEPLSPNPRVGMSSEWCGTSEPPSLEPKKSWARSKSLKVRMSMLVYPSFSLAPAPVQPQPTAPHLPATANIGPGNQNSEPVPQLSREPSQRIGTSSEWAGNSHPKTFLEVVMNRSKSVKTKSPKNDRLSVACPAAASSVAVAPAGNAAAELFADSGTSASAGVAGERQNKSSGKSSLPSMTRSKSLKFLKNIRKPKGDQPTAAAPPEPSHSTTLGFRFGFGNRFRKPKGPRHQPDTWV
ncbi:tyrosine-protein phosphatase non-receptor type 22 isoform X1 [Anguilla rostrata]|uniref:tyrosine-protein phosphatase non-receptor type 22 isoform X1 n=1 Tax=Anguilla rostrata TaxID=7938 RepID=UPI0030D4FA19